MPTYDENVLRPGMVRPKKNLKKRRAKAQPKPKPETKEEPEDNGDVVIDLRIRLGKGNKFSFGNIEN